MYERIDHGNGQIEIREYFKSPMVYLDHWALNDISLDKALRDRFIQVMNVKGGMLRLSIYNMIELSKQLDLLQVEAILDMIGSVHDCGLINVDPEVVIKKENALIANPSLIFEVRNPSAEVEIVAEYLMAHNHPPKWHVADVIRTVIPELPTTHLPQSNSEFVQDMERLLGIGRGEELHLRRAEKRFKSFKKAGPKYQRPTREVRAMALDFVMRTSQMKMSEYSEWADLFHVIVPVSYCDVVVIDKRWKSFVSQTGFSYPDVAIVFDKRSLNGFFTLIETWKDTEPIVPPDRRGKALASR
jgi:hypothetical protein